MLSGEGRLPPLVGDGGWLIQHGDDFFNGRSVTFLLPAKLTASISNGEL